MKNKISNVSFEQLKSAQEGYKEFRVSFLRDGKKEMYFTFVKEGKGVDYLKEAKKSFETDVKSGRVDKIIKRGHSHLRPVLIASTSVLGVAAVTFASLFIWKLLSKNDPVIPPDPPTDVEYIDNYTKESNYSIDNEDEKTLLNEITREYDENWVVTKEKRTTYQNGAPWGIDTTTIEYDEKYRVTKKYQESTKTDGTIIAINSIDNKYDKQGRIIEQINLHTDGPISSADNINIKKMSANFVDDENYVKREETYQNDILTYEKDIENHSTIGNNEKTITSVAHSATYTSTGDPIQEEDYQDTVLMKYDNLSRITFSQEKEISTLERGGETGSSDKEDTISYIYDSDDSLSYQLEESTKEVVEYEGEVTSSETSRKGYYEVTNSQVEELYHVIGDPHSPVPVFNTYYLKVTTLYDDLDREVSKKAYIDVGFLNQNSFNTEHSWRPLKSAYTTYIGKTNKILSAFTFDVDYSNLSQIKYEISDSTRKVDKYNRWVSDDKATYTAGQTSSGSITYVEREYAEPVPVNPDIPQPIEE